MTTTGASWRELRPHGRDIFYEGDEPETFASQIYAEFGFDPSAEPDWGLGHWYLPDGGRMPDPFGRIYMFHCPPEHVDAIYCSGRWELGS